MVMNNPRGKLNQTSFGGFEVKLARIQQIVPERAVAIVIDSLKHQHEVPLNVQRAKGWLPLVGEVWYLQKLMGQWMFYALVSNNYESYVQTHLVEVQSIDNHIATVVSETGRTFEVNANIQRAKGSYPKVGEMWYIDNTIANQYTFAAFLMEPPEAMEFGIWKSFPLGPGIVDGSADGSGTFGHSPAYRIEVNPFMCHIRGIFRKDDDSDFSGSTTVGFMPEEVRPSRVAQMHSTVTNSGGQSANTGRCEVNDSGEMIVRLPGTVVSPWLGIDAMFYFLDDEL